MYTSEKMGGLDLVVGTGIVAGTEEVDLTTPNQLKTPSKSAVGIPDFPTI